MALSAARSSAAAAPTRARTEASPPAVERTPWTTSTSSPSAPNRHGAESSLFQLARPRFLTFTRRILRPRPRNRRHPCIENHGFAFQPRLRGLRRGLGVFFAVTHPAVSGAAGHPERPSLPPGNSGLRRATAALHRGGCCVKPSGKTRRALADARQSRRAGRPCDGPAARGDGLFRNGHPVRHAHAVRPEGGTWVRWRALPPSHRGFPATALCDGLTATRERSPPRRRRGTEDADDYADAAVRSIGHIGGELPV